MISADSQQNIIFMNPVAEKISGWKQAEAQGKSLREVLYITQGDQARGWRICTVMKTWIAILS